METIFSFGQWVRERRRVLRLRQAEVAQLVGCSVVLVRKIESDERQPSREIAERLARVLHLPPDEWPAFVRSARSQLAVDRLPSPGRGAHIVQPGSAMFLVPALPIQPVGRTAAVTEIHALLGRARLLTLSGPPGVGKTTLALMAAPGIRQRYRDGIAFISLAVIRDPQQLPAIILRTLDIPEQHDKTAEQTLFQACQNRQILLILDNFEHLLDAAHIVSSMLAKAPQMHMLITSRSALHVHGEYLFPVMPLAQADALALFQERASAVHHDFVIDNSNREAVNALLQRLDCVPLAIELAAASTPFFSPHMLLQRLSELALKQLHSGIRDLPARHQSLFDAIAWSYALLMPEDQALFRFLGVFVGGCTVEALVATKSGATTADILNQLSRLCDHSLIMLSAGRCRLLETLRVFALDQLTMMHERDAAHASHAEYYRSLVLQVHSSTKASDHIEWLEYITSDSDNVRAALQYLADSDQHEYLGQMVSALLSFWIRRNSMSEGQYWLDQLLAAERMTAATHIQVLIARSRIHMECGNLHGAEHCLSKALALSRTIGDEEQLASIMADLGQVRLWLGHARSDVELLLNQSLDIFRQHGHQKGIALALSGLGWLANLHNEHAHAITLHQEALNIRRATGDSLDAVASSLGNLSVVAENTGDVTALISYDKQRRECHVAMGDMYGVMIVTRQLGYAYSILGDHEQAFAEFQEGLTLCRSMNNIQQITLMLNAMTYTALEAGMWDDAFYYAHENHLVAFRSSDRLSQLWATYSRAIVALARQEYTIAEQHFQVLLKKAQLYEDPKHTCRALQGLGMVARRRNLLPAAQEYLEQSLALSERHSVPSWSGWTHSELGLLAITNRHNQKARFHTQCGLRLLHRSIKRYLCVIALEAHAVAELKDDPERTAILLGAAAKDRRQRSNPIWYADQHEQAGWQMACRELLGEQKFTHAWEHGQRLTHEHAIRFALGEQALV